jgi:RNA polymerase sigma-70 factor (ECF subfamily)
MAILTPIEGRIKKPIRSEYETSQRSEWTNEGWVSALRSSGAEQAAALMELRSVLQRGLPYALTKWIQPSDPRFNDLVEEIIQETLIRVVTKLDTFEGRSKFSTWVYKIAVRIAITEFRRKRWQDVLLEDMLEAGTGVFDRGILADSAISPELSAEQADLAYKVKQVIDEKLTEKQRMAMIATGINGAPIKEVAYKMRMETNALYKLLHDARKKLKKELLAMNLSSSYILEAFSQ